MYISYTYKWHTHPIDHMIIYHDNLSRGPLWCLCREGDHAAHWFMEGFQGSEIVAGLRWNWIAPFEVFWNCRIFRSSNPQTWLLKRVNLCCGGSACVGKAQSWEMIWKRLYLESKVSKQDEKSAIQSCFHLGRMLYSLPNTYRSTLLLGPGQDNTLIDALKAKNVTKAWKAQLVSFVTIFFWDLSSPCLYITFVFFFLNCGSCPCEGNGFLYHNHPSIIGILWMVDGWGGTCWPEDWARHCCSFLRMLMRGGSSCCISWTTMWAFSQRLTAKRHECLMILGNGKLDIFISRSLPSKCI